METKYRVTGRIEWQEERVYACHAVYDMIVEAPDAASAVELVRSQHFFYEADEQEQVESSKGRTTGKLEAVLLATEDDFLWQEELERRRLAEERQNMRYMQENAVPLFPPSQIR